MNLDQFCQVARSRILTPEEFLSFIEAQGWRVELCEGGGAFLRDTKGDPLARALARMLAREPYRTNVLKLAAEKWRRDEPPGLREEAPLPARQWLWRDGHTFAEDVLDSPGGPDWHPAGAWWWRFAGEEGWRVIEERCDVACVGAGPLRSGECLPPGEHMEEMP